MAAAIESRADGATTNAAKATAETRSDSSPTTGTVASSGERESSSIEPAGAKAPAVALGMTSNERKSSVNFGTIVFASFSFLSLVVCFVKGIVPIYAMESVMWSALAWYCYKKSPLSQNANLIVLLLAVAVAAGEGYSVGAHSGGRSYTYLQQGNLQYRVDSHLGAQTR